MERRTIFENDIDCITDTILDTAAEIAHRTAEKERREKKLRASQRSPEPKSITFEPLRADSVDTRDPLLLLLRVMEIMINCLFRALSSGFPLLCVIRKEESR